MARQTDLSAAIAKIDADIKRLEDIRAYLTNHKQTDAPAVAKPKRGRKPKAAKDVEQGVF